MSGDTVRRWNDDRGVYEYVDPTPPMNPHQKPQEDVVGLLPFNINGTVYVRLTDAGRAFHRARHEERYPSLIYSAPGEDDGWSKWQLWNLMQELGDAIYMGGPIPFETTMRLDAPTYEAGRRDMREAAGEVALNPGFIEARDTEWDEGVNYAKRYIATAIRALPTEPLGGEGNSDPE